MGSSKPDTLYTWKILRNAPGNRAYTNACRYYIVPSALTISSHIAFASSNSIIVLSL